MVNVKNFERSFNNKSDREMSKLVDTVEDKIQNAILTSMEKFVFPIIELAVGSINTTSGREATSVTASSERGKT